MSGSFLSEASSVREDSPIMIGHEEDEEEFVCTQQVDRPLAGAWRGEGGVYLQAFPVRSYRSNSLRGRALWDQQEHQH